jgi:hypothetical protein
MSSYQDRPRPFSDTELSCKVGRNEDDPDDDLISFLAITQVRDVPILPITWQRGQEVVGQGGTSLVTQASMTGKLKFAFKCLSDDQKQNLRERNLSEADVFRTLTNEVAILGHPKLRQHPNILHLEGVAWDVQSDGEVWPALVFEKTPIHDSYEFFHLPMGKSLSLAARLKLCVDIGSAIIDMNSISRIIKFWHLGKSG